MRNKYIYRSRISEKKFGEIELDESYRNHINGIENFWGLCKVRLTRFRGIHKHKFNYHLKECEFRFNNKDKNLYIRLLKIIRNKPLKLS